MTDEELNELRPRCLWRNYHFWRGTTICALLMLTPLPWIFIPILTVPAALVFCAVDEKILLREENLGQLPPARLRGTWAALEESLERKRRDG